MSDLLVDPATLADPLIFTIGFTIACVIFLLVMLFGGESRQ